MGIPSRSKLIGRIKNISSEITDLSNYFVTSDGRNLITIMLMAFNDAEELQHIVKIHSL